jgi:hypothetical protein
LLIIQEEHMDTNALLTAIMDAMVKKAEEIYAATPDYHPGR